MAFDQTLRLRVRTVCCAHGVSVTAIAGYWDFAQQVDKGRRKLHGEELRLYVAAEIYILTLVSFDADFDRTELTA